MQFLRRHSGRIVIGVVLAACAWWIMTVIATGQREQRIARRIQSSSGTVDLVTIAPAWIQSFSSAEIPFLNRIFEINLNGCQVPPDLLNELQLLDHLRSLTLSGTAADDDTLKYLQRITAIEDLRLSNTRVTDVGCQSLKQFKRLRYLTLLSTSVSDAGLESLASLKDLQSIDLDNTPTTSAGREALRKALPNCTITPDP